MNQGRRDSSDQVGGDLVRERWRGEGTAVGLLLPCGSGGCVFLAGGGEGDDSASGRWPG